MKLKIIFFITWPLSEISDLTRPKVDRELAELRIWGALEFAA
jgi:hypothetical protein